MSLLVVGLTAGSLTGIAGAQVKKHSVFLACEVTDTGGIHDKSFNYSAYTGLINAWNIAGHANMSTAILSSSSSSDYTPNINTFIHEGCGIIITVGFLMDSATGAAASAHHNQKFAIVDDVPTTTSHNVLGLTYATNQDAFLAGALSASESKKGSVATYGGINIPPVAIYMDGFVAGVRWFDKTYRRHVKVYGWTPATHRNFNDGTFAGTGVFTGDFTNTTNGKNVTNTFYGQDKADIVFPVAGNVGLGSVAAAASAGRGHYVDWVDTDGCVSASIDCKYFPMSVTKGVTASVQSAVLTAFHGTFHGGSYVGTLKNGGAVLVVDKHAIVETSAQKSMIATITAAIEAGHLSVDPNAYPVVP